jgi:hypothetical protein
VGPYIPHTTEAIDCKWLAVRVNRFGRFPRQKRPPAPLETKATSKNRTKVLVVVVVVVGLSQREPPIETKERGTIDMALENGTYVNSLVPANPASTDGLAQADDHIRLIKSTLKNTFPNLTGVVTATQADLNNTTSIPSSLTDLGITDGTASGQVLTTDGSGNFSFTALPAGTTDTNYYVTGGSISGTTLTLNRQGLGSVSISGLPAAVTSTSQLVNNSGFITSQYTPPTSVGAVGTYAWLGRSTAGIFTAGSSYSGSGLTYSGILSTTVYNDDTAASIGTVSPSGTWRAMGTADRTTVRAASTLFLRIS